MGSVFNRGTRLASKSWASILIKDVDPNFNTLSCSNSIVRVDFITRRSAMHGAGSREHGAGTRQVRGQRTEVGGQGSEDRGQMSEDRVTRQDVSRQNDLRCNNVTI